MSAINVSCDNDRQVVVVEDQTERQPARSLSHLVPNSDVNVTQIKSRLANEGVRIPFHAQFPRSACMTGTCDSLRCLNMRCVIKNNKRWLLM